MPADSPPSPAAESGLPDRALLSALEFAVGVAAAGAKLRPALPFPNGLKPYLKLNRLTAAALPTIRAVVEADPVFLRRLGLVATPELVDEVGMLWLTRPDGWQAAAADALAAAEADAAAADVAAELQREQRRRHAAEAAAARARVELVAMQESLAQAAASASSAQASVERLEGELAAARRQIRELETAVRKRSAAVANVADRSDADAAALAADIAALRAELAAAVEARDEALADRAGAPAARVDVERLRLLLHEALSLAGEAPLSGRAPRRSPLAIPGGLYGNSEAAAEHLLRAEGVTVLVDGYNVAKLGWPALSLLQQREAAIGAAETIARRWGTMVHIVFDGSSVVGAHTRSRLLVRVSFSPEGVTADDVLRAEVASIDPTRPVVVVTNDQAVVIDVKAAGANVVSSDAFLAVARR